MARVARVRLDELLLEQGYFADLRTAQSWVMTGKVVVEGSLVTKPGTMVRPDVDLHLRGRPLKYASRGGYKLEHALDRFNISLDSSVCLDAGASTGGFTDCMLQRGARLVYSIEVGHGQFRGKLAGDPRVVNRERTNIGDVKRTDLEPPIDFACADLSYLSLRTAVPILSGLFIHPPLIVCLVKPLYEGLSQSDKANVAGVAETLENMFGSLEALGFPASEVCASPILGGRGAIEFLALFGRGASSTRSLVDAALADIRAHPPCEISAYIAEDRLP